MRQGPLLVRHSERWTWIKVGEGDVGTKLTERLIERPTCPPGKHDCMFFDSEQRGLAVRVMAAGTKSYLAQYSHQGRKRRVPLGSTDKIGLADARTAALLIMARGRPRHRPCGGAQGCSSGQGRRSPATDHRWPARRRLAAIGAGR